MSSIVISGDTSGAITLAAPSVAGTNTATLPASTGTVMVSGNMPAFSVYQVGSQTVSNATSTKLVLNTKTYDTASAFDATTNYRFQPTVAGYYQFNGQLQWQNSTGNNYGGLQLLKNGTEFARGALQFYTYGYSCSGMCYLNGSSDYVELYVLQATGTSQSTNGGGTYVQLSGALVRNA
jgi:hypothetical protein